MIKTRSIELVRHQREWVAEWHFSLVTARQFTAEEHVVVGEGKRWWSALWDAWAKKRQLVLLVGAKRGEREAQGWA